MYMSDTIMSNIKYQIALFKNYKTCSRITFYVWKAIKMHFVEQNNIF